MLRNSIKILVGAVVITALAGCVQVYEDPASADVSKETIEIGVLTPLSGEAAVYGLAQQWVLNTAAEEINAAGGIGGKLVNLNFEDGGCDSKMANKSASSLISVKQVKVILGGFCSSETLASAPLAEQNKVVLLSSASSSAEVTKAGDYIFRNYPSDNAQSEEFAAYASKQGYKKIGIFAEEQPYSEGIADSFKAEFSALGGETVVEKFATDASDFRTQITKLQGASVDAYFVDTQAPAKADLLIKQLKEAGVKGPFIINDSAFGDREMLVRYKEYLEGSVGAEVPYEADNAKLLELRTKYKAEKGSELPVPTYMAPSYDALYIIKEAIEKVGYDSVKIKDYLYTVKDRKGLSGVLSFDSNGDPDESFRHVLKVLKNGEVEFYKE